MTTQMNLYKIRVLLSGYTDVTVMAKSRMAAYEMLDEMEFHLENEEVVQADVISEEPVTTAVNSVAVIQYKVRPEFWSLWGIENEDDSYIDEHAVNRMAKMLTTSRESISSMLTPLHS